MSAEFKAQVVLDALTGAETTSQLAEKHGVHPAMITRWKARARKGMVDVFRTRSSLACTCPVCIDQGRLGGAVHEMNNALGIILCYAQLLLREVPDRETMARDVAIIEKHARDCKRIAMDLLRSAREEAKPDAPAGCLAPASRRGLVVNHSNQAS